MRSRTKILPLLFVLVVFLLGSAATIAQTTPDTRINYQGRLMKSGNPVSNTTCDFKFRLFTAKEVGGTIGDEFKAYQIKVDNGLFSLFLDFGQEAFNAKERWLETKVCLSCR